MPSDSVRNQRGVAVLMALLMALLVGAIAAALITLTTTETIIGASFRHAREASYAAEAALERALHDLSTMPDWSMALSQPPANVISTFDDGEADPRTSDGRTIDLAQLTAERQAESDERDGPAVLGADSPLWRLFAHAPLSALSRAPGFELPFYLVVWVADDDSDGDGEPTVDRNHQLMVWAVALGTGGKRAITARIARTAGGDVRLMTRQEAP
jgi:hypothetical protein